jgi:type IV pilus assembly protein PilB
MLVEAGVVTEDELQKALKYQENYGERIASCLYKLKFSDERTLATYLSLQQGVPFVVLSESAISLKLLEALPVDISKKLSVLPLKAERQNLFVAISDTFDFPVLDELRFVTGLRVVELGALSASLDRSRES